MSSSCPISPRSGLTMPSASDLPTRQPKPPGGRAPDEVAVEQDRLGAACVDVGGAIDLHRDETVGETALAPRDERVAAEEPALVGMDEPVEPRFVRRVLDRHLAADQPVGFLQRHRHHGPDAEWPDAGFRARTH